MLRILFFSWYTNKKGTNPKTPKVTNREYELDAEKKVRFVAQRKKKKKNSHNVKENVLKICGWFRNKIQAGCVRIVFTVFFVAVFFFFPFFNFCCNHKFSLSSNVQILCMPVVLCMCTRTYIFRRSLNVRHNYSSHLSSFNHIADVKCRSSLCTTAMMMMIGLRIQLCMYLIRCTCVCICAHAIASARLSLSLFSFLYFRINLLVLLYFIQITERRSVYS